MPLNDISAAETYRMLQKAFDEETMSQKNVYKWFRERVSGLQLMTKTSTKSRKWFLEVVDMVGISFESVQTILKDHLGLRRVKSRLVPKFLNFFEKERRVGDESWIFVYDPETTDQSRYEH